MSAGTGEYFRPLQFHSEIMEVEKRGVAIYRLFEEFYRAKSYCHLRAQLAMSKSGVGITSIAIDRWTPKTFWGDHLEILAGRRVAGRQPPPQTLQELERALLEEWGRIPELVINSLIDSMPQRKKRKKYFNERILRIDWLAYSPDVDLIEHIWDIQGRWATFTKQLGSSVSTEVGFLMSVNPYDVQVEKLECEGLIQTCMGKRLLDLKSETEKKVK
ncbi:hypothetical protein TNCV_2083631 [Trichonephila clavipes]|uniref:Uncharacterized protein n=1 Tax=Trichonephila clavipes TaxID=2585209 RepID=A0A8X6RIU2_TRICX|nr:hypothetical protein TNCV_2083631 [Trichonephila clavipes]